MNTATEQQELKTSTVLKYLAIAFICWCVYDAPWQITLTIVGIGVSTVLLGFMFAMPAIFDKAYFDYQKRKEIYKNEV